MKTELFSSLIERYPEKILEKAIKGMLPKGKLGRKLFTNVKVYKGNEHPHEAQNPVPLTL
jgi:large subunit ribosomal protein L13